MFILGRHESFLAPIKNKCVQLVVAGWIPASLSWNSWRLSSVRISERRTMFILIEKLFFERSSAMNAQNEQFHNFLRNFHDNQCLSLFHAELGEHEHYQTLTDKGRQRQWSSFMRSMEVECLPRNSPLIRPSARCFWCIPQTCRHHRWLRGRETAASAESQRRWWPLCLEQVSAKAAAFALKLEAVNTTDNDIN